MAWRAWLERRLLVAWRSRGAVAWLLSPLSALHFLGYRLRRALAPSAAVDAGLSVPVIVIGNLYVGGTGKTPLTIEIVRALAARGRRPGIVSRGYGRITPDMRLINRSDPPAVAGDEPLLIARSTDAPVAVGRDRVAAARLLLARHPDLDCIVSDDGLQHRALKRDVEIAMVDERGLGNGWLLPAGPLREPPQRLRSVDAIVLHGAGAEMRATLDGAAHCFEMRTRLGTAWQLSDASQRRELDVLATEQAARSLRLFAAAGIGVPERFFSMLRGAGLAIEELPLPDHFEFDANSFRGVSADQILITEKDAVKCAAEPSLAGDTRIWVVPLVAALDPALIDFIAARIAHIAPEASLGSTSA